MLVVGCLPQSEIELQLHFSSPLIKSLKSDREDFFVVSPPPIKDPGYAFAQSLVVDRYLSVMVIGNQDSSLWLV